MHSGPRDEDDPAASSLWADVPLFEDPGPVRRPPAEVTKRSASNLPPPSSPPAPPPEAPSAQPSAPPSPWPSPSAPSAPPRDPFPPPRSPSAPTPPASVPPWTQRAPAESDRRLWPTLLAVFVVFNVLVVAGIFAALLASGDKDEDVASSERPEIERPSNPTTPEREAARDENKERASLLSPTGMRRALAEVKRRLGSDAQLQSVRVDEDSLQAIARKKLVIVKRDGTSDVLPGPPTLVAPFSVDLVDPGAPSRIEQSFDATGKKLFYTILSGLQYKGGVQWISFAADARSSGFRSDRGGRGLCALEKRC